jgi:hypothetical protein
MWRYRVWLVQLGREAAERATHAEDVGLAFAADVAARVAAQRFVPPEEPAAPEPSEDAAGCDVCEDTGTVTKGRAAKLFPVTCPEGCDPTPSTVPDAPGCWFVWSINTPNGGYGWEPVYVEERHGKWCYLQRPIRAASKGAWVSIEGHRWGGKVEMCAPGDAGLRARIEAVLGDVEDFQRGCSERVARHEDKNPIAHGAWRGRHSAAESFAGWLRAALKDKAAACKLIDAAQGDKPSATMSVVDVVDLLEAQLAAVERLARELADCEAHLVGARRDFDASSRAMLERHDEAMAERTRERDDARMEVCAEWAGARICEYANARGWGYLYPEESDPD